jgi:hypothetical protein
MKILTWNIRGAQNESTVWDALLDLCPDIALLQEVGAFPAKLADYFDIVSRPASQIGVREAAIMTAR